MNTRGTPIRIRSRHLLDQGSNFHAHLRLPTSAPRNPGPIDPEAFSLPSDHRVRLDHVQGLSPMGPVPESTTQNTRSFLRSLGTPFFLLSTPSCCRKARFSRARLPRSLKAAQIRIASHRSVSIMVQECGGNALKNQWLSTRRNFVEPPVQQSWWMLAQTMWKFTSAAAFGNGFEAGLPLARENA